MSRHVVTCSRQSRLLNRFRDTGSVQDSKMKRVNACIAERGGHLQHFFFIVFCFLI
jgi:hypothetical protein